MRRRQRSRRLHLFRPPQISSRHTTISNNSTISLPSSLTLSRAPTPMRMDKGCTTTRVHQALPMAMTQGPLALPVPRSHRPPSRNRPRTKSRRWPQDQGRHPALHQLRTARGCPEREVLRQMRTRRHRLSWEACLLPPLRPLGPRPLRLFSNSSSNNNRETAAAATMLSQASMVSFQCPDWAE